MTSERILAAARDGDATTVAELLAADPALAAAVDGHGKTPLHLAAEHDHPEVAERLLEAGADIEAWTSWGATPLQWAGVVGSPRPRRGRSRRRSRRRPSPCATARAR